ncbi:COG4223 family protein [Acidiphilium sp. C61]|jgi:hypothetical protein|uniref:COG4223 family protein n=1 Tax=Acidiphilium sp. C61 TaxID=1671485 RepID=UPI00157AF141|nr:hypothetical protein [Acidiphilium sp. C61]
MSEHDPNHTPPEFSATADPAPAAAPEPQAAEPAAAPDAAASPRNQRKAIGLAAVAILLLAGGELFLLRAQLGAAGQSARIDQLSTRIGALRGRVATLEQKLASVAAAENKPAPATPAPALPADLAARIGKIETSIAALSTTTLADHAAVTRLRQQSGDLPALVTKAKTLALLAQASLNLQNGLPLGEIPGAPAALAIYATAKPPTLAGLKASFATYAGAASDAAGDAAQQGGFWQRATARVESLVTLRHGDTVLVGSPAEGVLGKARTALARDDLGTAVNDLAKLPPKAATAMKPWTDEAAGLLAARTALAAMAEKG